MKRHLATIGIVFLMTLLAWHLGLMPAEGGNVNPSGNGGGAAPNLNCGQDTTHACGYNTSTKTWSNQAITGSAAPGGTNGQIQFNNAGALGGVTAVPVANGGTNATSAGATAAHNIGAAAEGANSDITSLTGLTTPLSVAQGGTGVTSTQGNGAKVQLSTGTTTTNDCVEFDANGNTVDAGAACGSGGGLNPGTTGNSVYYNGTTTGGPVANEFHAASGTIAAAFAACTQNLYQSNHSYAPHREIEDSNGNTEFVEACSGTCTSAAASTPTWPVSVGGQVVDNAGANQITWELIALGAYAPSKACNVILDPGLTYAASAPVLIGSDNVSQTLYLNGAIINCNDTGGTGHACLVEGDKGHIIGMAKRGSSATGNLVNQNGSTSIDSLVESAAGYLSTLPTNPIKYQQVNFDLSGVYVSPTPAGTIGKAAVWESAIDGSGDINNIFISGGPVGSIGLLADAAPTGSGFTSMFWNNLNFENVWIGLGSDGIGFKLTGTGGSGGSGVWTGGAIVDGNASNSEHVDIDGSSGSITGFSFVGGPYIEATSGETGDGFLINGARSITTQGVMFNAAGGSLPNCVHLTGSNLEQSYLQGTNFGGVCTNAINNAATGYVDPTSGTFVYPNPNHMNASVTLTGTDTVLLSAGAQKVVMPNTSGTAETITLSSTGVTPTASPTTQWPNTFEICQGTGGNDTLTFALSGISNLYWSGGVQPGYTLTASRCDWYSCKYDGTNIRCAQTMSNQP